MYSLVFFSIYNYYLVDPMQSYGFKYHLYADDSQTNVSSLDGSSEPQTWIQLPIWRLD